MTQQLHNKALEATVRGMMATREPPPSETATALQRQRTREKKRSHASSSSSSSTSDQCPLLLSPRSDGGAAEGESRSRSELGLSLDLSLGSYPSTDSLHVLGELLCDIRRSCTTSLTSTPIISSDGEMTVAADAVFESKLRRSETELRAMGERGRESVCLLYTCFCGVGQACGEERWFYKQPHGPLCRRPNNRNIVLPASQAGWRDQ